MNFFVDIFFRKITRVAKIEQIKFIQMMEAYPEWYIRLGKQERVNQIIRTFVNRLKGAVYQKKLASLNKGNQLKKKSRTLKDFKFQLTRRASSIKADLKTGLIELKQFSRSHTSSPSKYRMSPPRGIGSHSVISSITNPIEKPLIRINELTKGKDEKQSLEDLPPQEDEIRGTIGRRELSRSLRNPQESADNVETLDLPKDDQILKAIDNRPRSRSPPKSLFYHAESGEKAGLPDMLRPERETPRRTNSWNVQTLNDQDKNQEPKQNYSALVINKNNTSGLSSDAIPKGIEISLRLF